MDDTDVQAPNTDYKPKLHTNYKSDNNVDPGTLRTR